MKKYQLFIDPIPSCKGFPKALPDEAVLCGGKGYDLFVNPRFDLQEWIKEQGYSEPLGYYKYYAREV